MNVLVTASARMIVTPDGNLWTPISSLDYTFWARYLEVYDTVGLMVRSVPAPAPPEGYRRATGPGVQALPVPALFSPKELLRQYRPLRQQIRGILARAQAVHLRLPCPVGETVASLLKPDQPFGVEVVGDPYDVYAPGNNRHAFRPILRWWATRTLKHICARATGVAYVTRWTLQRRYPPATGAFTTHYSSIHLTDEAFVATPRCYARTPDPVRLVSVGTMEELYKGFHVLIEAVRLCTEQGMNAHLTLVGDGKYRHDFQAQAATAGIAHRVCFTGYLSSDTAIREQLDNADLFVLPSFQEGLPRAVIEAMARALPCLGSTVGGMPELLAPSEMVAPGDAVALAHGIRRLVEDPHRLTRLSGENLSRAREYHHDTLRTRRTAFYRYIRKSTEDWMQSPASS